MEKGIIENYFNIVRRWLWLLLLTTLIASTTTYWLVQQQPPIYEANVRLIIGPGIDSTNPSLNELRTGGQLMQTYAELTTMLSILQIVIDDLGLDINPKKLKKNIDVKPYTEAQILTIIVQDGNREQAMIIANGIADVLVRLSPSRPDNPEAKLKDRMRSQAVKVEASIATFEALIEQLEADLQATNNVKDQGLIVDQLTKERDHLSEANRTLASLYDSLQRASTNQVKVIEPANDGNQVNPQFQLKLAISALAGLVLGLVIALAFEYLDDTVKAVDDLIHQISDIPLLGIISKYKIPRQINQVQLVVQALPDSIAAENYRMLGTKLLSKKKKTENQEDIRSLNVSDVQQLPAGSLDHLGSILVSSLQPDDDVGEIAANLAVVLAKTGQQVILVDASLHRPTISPLFDITDREGLTATLMANSKTPEPVPIGWVPGLSILPGGSVPANPFELLASPGMADLIKQLEKQADIIIIAGSSLLSFADSLILASRVDGVVVVARHGKVHRHMISEAMGNLRSLQANIVGVIFDLNHSSQALKPFHTWLPSILKRQKVYQVQQFSFWLIMLKSAFEKMTKQVLNLRIFEEWRKSLKNLKP